MELSFTPLSLTVVLVGGVLILGAPRDWVFPVFFLVSLFLSMRNNCDVFGFALTPHRLMLVFSWTRVLLRGEHRHLTLTRIDWWLLLLTVCTALAYILLWGDFAAVVNRVGFVYNVAGLYFLFRVLISSREDLEHVIGWVARATVLLAVFMSIELVTQRNPLALLGHIDAEVQNRLGRLRCQAAFGHPISAGTFGATLLPLWIACRWQAGALRKWSVIGAVSCTIITVAAGSSTPLGAYVAAWLGLGLWRFRQHMRVIRWAVLFTLVSLHLVMEAPVWALIARINFTSGNSGYHRYKLVDAFINRFGEWWLVGVESTEDWGYLMHDVANQFVLFGIRGGLLGLALFLLLLGACFREVGRLVHSNGTERSTAMLIWSYGAMLFAHCVLFLGYSYWDQIMVLWYLLLAMCASLHYLAPTQNPVPVPVLATPAAHDRGRSPVEPTVGPAW